MGLGFIVWCIYSKHGECLCRQVHPCALVDHYEGYFDDTDRERAVFYACCKRLEDIAYGTRTGARPYAEAGLAHLAQTFEEFA